MLNDIMNQLHVDTKNKRLLGIDYGTKRVGLAISDENRQFALPLVVISNTTELCDEIVKNAKEHEVKEIVIGESRNYKGEPNAIFLDADSLKKKLEREGFKVYLELEFMTSQQAERFQGKNSMTDASAAALILQSYLDKQKI
ncbi:MAG: RuvX/YqgF family protein [Candidatus Taylorbacteria bacterium]